MEETQGLSLLSVRQVAEKLSISISLVWRLTKEEKRFPKPIKIGYRSCWRSDEVESYIEFRTRIHRGTGAARNQPSHAQAA